MGTVEDSATLWFQRHAAQGEPRRRLVILPHAGGAASFFFSWGGRFGDDTEVLAARYPGRQERIAEPCIDSMEPLADAVSEALFAIPGSADVPLVLFGHSMGASLAYEVTLRLVERHGVTPERLFVSSRSAPHRCVPNDRASRSDEELIEEIAKLGGDAQTEFYKDPDLRELAMPALRSDFRITDTYVVPEPRPVDCPIVAYLGDADHTAKRDSVAAWSDVTRGDFSLRVFPGDHFYLVPQRAAVIEDMILRME